MVLVSQWPQMAEMAYANEKKDFFFIVLISKDYPYFNKSLIYSENGRQQTIFCLGRKRI
jgi:hypothetical protein